MTEINVLALARRAIQNLFGRAPGRMNDVAVNPRQPNRFHASVTQGGENVRVDLAREDHLRHLQRRIIRHAPAVDDGLLHAHLHGQFRQLFSAAVNHAGAYPDLMQQGQFFGERRQILRVISRLAGQFDDERLALEALNVRQRLAQKIETELGCIIEPRLRHNFSPPGERMQN
jgi:hypothetical protein